MTRKYNIGDIYDCGQVRLDNGDASYPYFIDGSLSVIDSISVDDRLISNNGYPHYLISFDKKGNPTNNGRRFYRNWLDENKKVGQIGITHNIVNNKLVKIKKN